MSAYYNEIDPYAAAWLRNLIDAGLLPEGDVDERSIEDVAPEDLAGYDQCHFFAGIGGWPYALRLAGWPDDRPAWTGSCPCQPFSVAGAGKGTADERHLWPAFHRLIAERRPAVVLGEQAASADGVLWLAGVRADLEASGYAVGAADLPAAGVGAPHIRQRLYWLADAGHERAWRAAAPGEAEGGRALGDVAGRSARGGVGDADDDGPCGAGGIATGEGCVGAHGRLHHRADPWGHAILIPCGDGKARRIEPGILCLVNGLPFVLADGRTVKGTSRAALLKGLGNAIVPPLAAEFITAYLEVER